MAFTNASLDRSAEGTRTEARQYRDTPARLLPSSSATVTSTPRRPRLRVTARALRRLPGVTRTLTLALPPAHGIASRARHVASRARRDTRSDIPRSPPRQRGLHLRPRSEARSTRPYRRRD